MTETSQSDGGNVEVLKRARDTLGLQLEAHECWRALRQLDERDARGDSVQSIDGGALRRHLEAALDGSCPGWRAWGLLGDAIATVADWRPGVTLATTRPLVSVPTAEPSAGTVTEANFEPPGSPILMSPSEPVATLTMADPPPSQPADLARIRQIGRALDVPASQSARGDRFGGAVPWGRLGEPPPVPAEPVAPDRQVGPSQGIVQAAPPARMPTSQVQPGPMATTGKSVPSLAMSAAAARAFAPIKPSPPSRDAVPPPPETAPLEATANLDVGPVSSPISETELADHAGAFVRSEDQPGPAGVTVPLGAEADRLSRLEADLEEIVGASASAHRRPARAASEAFDDDLDVEEAEVTIVARRPELEAPEPEAPRASASRPPVALSIRLKEGARTVEFDSTDYAAYHDDVEEADVEIIRPGDDRNGTPTSIRARPDPASSEPPKPSSGRRFLKVLSRE